MIYDANVFQLVDSEVSLRRRRKDRDIVEAKLQHDGDDLYVFMNHWPSRGNDEWQRCLAAAVLRKRLDEILAADPKADIIMLGDFNDEPDNVSHDQVPAVDVEARESAAGALFDTTAHIRAGGKGTFVYENKWDLLDHIIISRACWTTPAFTGSQTARSESTFPS